MFYVSLLTCEVSLKEWTAHSPGEELFSGRADFAAVIASSGAEQRPKHWQSAVRFTSAVGVVAASNGSVFSAAAHQQRSSVVAASVWLFRR